MSGSSKLRDSKQVWFFFLQDVAPAHPTHSHPGWSATNASCWRLASHQSGQASWLHWSGSCMEKLGFGLRKDWWCKGTSAKGQLTYLMPGAATKGWQMTGYEMNHCKYPHVVQLGDLWVWEMQTSQCRRFYSLHPTTELHLKSPDCQTISLDRTGAPWNSPVLVLFWATGVVNSEESEREVRGFTVDLTL